MATALPMAMAGGGGLLSAYGDITAGMAGKFAGDQSAAIEESNAQFAREAGEDRAKMILTEGDTMRSSVRARASASGLVADTGSPLLIQEETLYRSSVDANKARYSASMQPYGYRSRASLYRFYGSQSLKLGYMGAAGSLLNAGGGAAAMGMGK